MGKFFVGRDTAVTDVELWRFYKDGAYVGELVIYDGWISVCQDGREIHGEDFRYVLDDEDRRFLLDLAAFHFNRAAPEYEPLFEEHP